MCLYPRLIKNPKFKANKKSGGVIPTVNDVRTLYVPIGCQNCIECRKQKAREWRVRLLEDIKEHTNGKFITLTFSNEHIQKLIAGQDTDGKQICEPLQSTGYTLDNEIATIATRRFLERWRKHYKRSLRHWLVTELGHNGTENIHLHGLIWTNEPIELLDKYWKYGFTWKGKYINGKYIQYVNGKTISYICKYVHKMDFKHKVYKPIILTSPGIGGNYKGSHNKFNGSETDETYRTNTGHRMALPIYWRNKIYSDSDKEELWTQKLDEQNRYVLGVKIDISKTDKDYLRQVDAARKLNKELGYGDHKKDWNRTKYEHETRIIMQATRINNNNKK